MKSPSIFFARSILMLFFPNSSQAVSRTYSHNTIWYRLCVIKFTLATSLLHFLVLFYLRHVTSIGTSCTDTMKYIIKQLLNQGGTVEKMIEKTRGSRYLSVIGISLVPHSNLNSIHFSPFALRTILIDRHSLFHAHIYTNI